MVVTAGMVQGTPDWQLDLMRETETAAEWESQNTPADTEMLKLAGRELEYAIDELDRACDSVNAAMEDLVDTPEGDRVASILQEMEEELKNLRSMKDKWLQGVA